MKRKIAFLLATMMLATSLAACGQPADQGAEDAAASETSEAPEIDLSIKEAPMLTERVEKGELPPLEERLPVADDVMIEPDVVELGQYGGSMTTRSYEDGRWNWGPLTEQSLFRFKQDNSGEVEPNICKNFYSNEDATVWTIELREGMKWSDGEPLTADDFIFYYDHMSTPALNPDRTPVPMDSPDYYGPFTSEAYSCYQVEKDGKTYWADYEKVDDYTFTVTFAAPNPAFPVNVAIDNKWGVLPKHFYVNYVSRKDGVTDDPTFPYITEEEAIANANRDFGKQWDTYSAMGKSIGLYNWDYAIVPQLRSFIAVEDNWDQVGETYELVRNPYFWKTDSAGRQLPYLDSIQVKIISDEDQVTLQAMAGEFDHYAPQTDFTTVATATQETHHVVLWKSSYWCTENQGLMLNQTVKDLDKRALFQDIRFREALSIAVDRNLLNETLLNGISEPWQSSVPEGLEGYDPEWSKQWIEYDVDRANEILDELTEPWDRTDGTYRKMKGTDKDVEIVVSIREPSESGDLISLLQAAYRKIGVHLVDKVDADYKTKIMTNDVEASLEHISVLSPAVRANEIVPCTNEITWYSAYGKWYADGKTEATGGIEPTGDIMELVNAYDAIRAAAGEERDAIVEENTKKIYDLHKKNQWVIGFLRPADVKLIISNDLMNVPEGLIDADEFRYFGYARPEQFWKKSTAEN